MAYEPDLDWESSLIEAMRDDLAAYMTPDLLDETLLDLLEPLNPAEAVNVGKALSQIQNGAAAALADPTVRQIAQVALPIAGGAVGGAAGAQVGALIGNRLQAPASTGPASAVPPVGKPPAAVRALAATQMHDTLAALLAAGMGPAGQRVINGIPVAALLATLSSLFAQAAAEADRWSRQSPGATAATAEGLGAWDPPDDDVYASLVASESLDLAEALS